MKVNNVYSALPNSFFFVFGVSIGMQFNSVVLNYKNFITDLDFHIFWNNAHIDVRDAFVFKTTTKFLYNICCVYFICVQNLLQYTFIKLCIFYYLINKTHVVMYHYFHYL